MFQATMMTIYMIIGVRAYRKIGHFWSRQGFVFGFQTFIIMYLLINEFTHRHITGIFVILLFTQYSLFLTFNIVVDSMISPTQDDNIKDSKLRMFNRVFRIVMHTVTLGLLISSFFMPGCDTSIYPRNFIFVTCIILTHQVYDLFLKYNNFMIDWENLPYKSKN